MNEKLLRRDGSIVVHECRPRNEDGTQYYPQIKIWQNDFEKWFMDVETDIMNKSRVDYPISYCPFCGEKLENECFCFIGKEN